MRIVNISALILLTFAACSGCRATLQLPAIEQMLRARHSALVEVSMGTGTGFPIRDDAFLTAWHVVDGENPENVTVGGLQAISIMRVGELDAAIIFTAQHGLTPWPLADRLARPGERVFKSGYGQGDHWWAEGIATEDPYRVALDIFHGDSGGPIYDSEGNVLGIIVTLGCYGFQGRVLHHCGAVPMTEVLDALPDDFWARRRSASSQPCPGGA